MTVMADDIMPTTIDELVALLTARLAADGLPEVFCPYCDITFLEDPDIGFGAVDEIDLRDHMADVHTTDEAARLYQALNEVAPQD
jgi:hypothetical protein